VQAAVVIPVYREQAGDLRLVLVVRGERGVHGGQLALPGGKREPGDATPATFIAGASCGTTTITGTSSSRPASARACAWFPDDAPTTPRGWPCPHSAATAL
jgi:8-oxo-dGTP pyrophosphatase MutT (NUDIX family)